MAVAASPRGGEIAYDPSDTLFLNSTLDTDITYGYAERGYYEVTCLQTDLILRGRMNALSVDLTGLRLLCRAVHGAPYGAGRILEDTLARYTEARSIKTGCISSQYYAFCVRGLPQVPSSLPTSTSSF